MLEAMGRGLAREKEGRDALLPESRQHISGAEHTLHIMEQAPVNLFIVNPLGLDLDLPATPEQRIYEICNAQSIGAAVENMTLAAEGLGLGSLWICDIFFAYRELNQWLGTQGTLAAAMALGYADEAPGPRPRNTPKSCPRPSSIQTAMTATAARTLSSTMRRKGFSPRSS